MRHEPRTGYVPRIISAVVGLALVGAAVYLLTSEQDDHVPLLLTGGLTALGLLGTLAGARLGEPRSTTPRRGRRPPSPPGTTLLLFAIATSATLTQGCGADALSTHARAALATTTAVRVVGEAADAARAAALDEVEREHPADPEHDEAVRAEAARWRPLGQALDAVRAAVGGWIEAIELARLAGDDSVSLAALLPLGARVLELYARAAALARELGADAPALPPVVTALAGGES